MLIIIFKGRSDTMSITNKIKETIMKKKAAKLLSDAKDSLAMIDPDNMGSEVYAALYAAYKTFSPARKRWLKKSQRLAKAFRKGRISDEEMVKQYLALEKECAELDRKEMLID